MVTILTVINYQTGRSKLSFQVQLVLTVHWFIKYEFMQHKLNKYKKIQL